MALEEALKTIDPNKEECEELVTVQTELNLQPVNTELWLTLPRLFSRSSARFELPIDSRLLTCGSFKNFVINLLCMFYFELYTYLYFTAMTPLDYAFQYVYISSPRKILYSCVFDKFRLEDQRLMHSEVCMIAIKHLLVYVIIKAIYSG